DYDPDDPVIVPIRDDMRYRSWKETMLPESNAVIIYMMDVSGSMTDDQKDIVRTEAFWIDTWLRSQYQGIQRRYIVHDVVAHVERVGPLQAGLLEDALDRRDLLALVLAEVVHLEFHAAQRGRRRGAVGHPADLDVEAREQPQAEPVLDVEPLELGLQAHEDIGVREHAVHVAEEQLHAAEAGAERGGNGARHWRLMSKHQGPRFK
ncbi:MAG: DUF444 family protein, partial [Verrucomicrobiae bacterium]|nr:DUF444 family protein [Verrucomicrobiae bacterium]